MMTIGEIKRLLPHRYPMLLVDRIVDVDPGVWLTALKAVTVNEPWYRAVPDDAAEDQHDYPVTLVLESWCQAAAVLANWDQPGACDGQVMLIGRVSEVEVRHPVLPGDLLEHRVRLVHSNGSVLVFEGETLVGEEVVLTVGSLILTIRPARDLAGYRGRGGAELVLTAPGK